MPGARCSPDAAERSATRSPALALLARRAAAIWPASAGAADRGPLHGRSRGVTWFAGDVSSALLYAHRGPLVHLLLTYPSGRVALARGAWS